MTEQREKAAAEPPLDCRVVLREAVEDIMKYQFSHSREAMSALQRLVDAADAGAGEIERLRRYADAMNGKPETERHIYNGACPDNGQPDSRDPECPACRLLVPNNQS